MSGRVPPSSRANARIAANSQIAKAARRFTRFTGHDAEIVERVEIAPMPKAVTVFGECTAVCYVTTRDGREEHYKHEFAAHSAPLLCASPDGKRLFLIGGKYKFTERGIVDKGRGRR